MSIHFIGETLKESQGADNLFDMGKYAFSVAKFPSVHILKQKICILYLPSTKQPIMQHDTHS